MNPITTYDDLLSYLSIKKYALDSLPSESNGKPILHYFCSISKNDDIERFKKSKNKILGIIFTRPETRTGQPILNSIEYFHYQSGENTHFYFPGYSSPNKPNDKDNSIFTLYHGGNLQSASHSSPACINDIEKIGTWAFSPEIQIEFIESFEKASSGIYSGNSELVLLEYDKEGFNFGNTIVLNLDELIKIDDSLTINRLFMEI